MTIRKILPTPLLRAIDPAGDLPLPAGQPGPSSLERYAKTFRQTTGGPKVATLAPTPTRNDRIPFKRGGFQSLCAALDHAAQGDTGLNFFDARGHLLDVLSYSRLQIEAHAFARRLIGAGIERGERLLLIADTWRGFCVGFFGAQYAGVIPVPVSVPVGLGAKTRYIAQLKRQIEAAGAIGILAPDDLADFARTAAEGTTVRIAGAMKDFETLPEAASPLRPFGADEPCYIQFSSGSTRVPQGIDIRQNQLMANIDGSLAAQEICETDAGVSWLPFYHDMGLIGFVLAPICAQRSVDLMAPHDFARRPLQWLALISRRRASITYSPSFGYDLAVRRALTQPLGEIDLSCLRLAGIGADMIQPSVLNRFAETFAATGFDRRAFLPSYGMAEVCVGVTFGRSFGGLTVDTFTDHVTGKSRDFVVCGAVMAGHRVDIRDERGVALGERHIGRIFVSGPSVMPGYFRPDADTPNPVRDGWLDTGDLGYWHEKELVITGRAKDLIIVNGRNVWPQDIEWAVEALPQLRRSSACAFSIDHAEGEAVVVVVENRPDDLARRLELEGEIRQAVKEAVGLDSQIILIGRQPGLPRTSSGKLARAHAKTQFLAGAYAEPLPLVTA